MAPAPAQIGPKYLPPPVCWCSTSWVQVEYKWSTSEIVEDKWSTSEVQVEYKWNSGGQVKYKWSTSEIVEDKVGQ